MSENLETPRPKYPEWIIVVVSIFFFFSLVGTISQLIPTIYSDIQAFFLNFTLTTVPNVGITLPAPASPGVHLNVYSAASTFCLAFGFFTIVILVVRIVGRAPSWRKAENLSGMIWWLGASYIISTLLNAAATIAIWFAFWAVILMLIGGSLVIRALLIAIMR